MRVRRSQHLERYRIRGGNRLHGEVEISGAKNAAVAIIPAALMVNGKCRIENLPQISDTEALLLILESLGAKVEQIDRSTVEIDATNATWMGADYDRMRKIRASYYFVGSMLGRFGIARTTMPGGCNFGVRPIDQHVKGMNALGAEVDISDFITAHVPGGRLRGASVYLDKVSVGATMNIMIAAVLAEGRTIIENAAREPHIVDLANFLNSMGADVRGAGTDTIKVNGVEQLHGGTYTIIPDQIEAGTYMAATAAVGGEVLIKNVIPKHTVRRPSMVSPMMRHAPRSSAKWASRWRNTANPSSSARRGVSAAPTSRPSRTPASRPICSRRSAWRSRWRRGRASSPRAFGITGINTSTSCAKWARP